MNKELSLINIIRLDTELENAIGFREHYLKINDFKLYAIWDQEVEHILDQIRELGEQ